MLDIGKLKEWMKREGYSREWLADAIGAKKGTLNNFFTNEHFPEWAAKHIARIMREHRELRFTEQEFDLIERARILAGYQDRQEFFLAAINAYARQIASPPLAPLPDAPPARRIAEEDGSYNFR